jgi:hypothetical protein
MQAIHLLTSSCFEEWNNAGYSPSWEPALSNSTWNFVSWLATRLDAFLPSTDPKKSQSQYSKQGIDGQPFAQVRTWSRLVGIDPPA